MRILLISLLYLYSGSSLSQSLKNFHLNVALGLADPSSGYNSQSGFLVAVEPKFGISRQFDIGIRYESASMVRGTGSQSTSNTDERLATQSLLLTTAVTVNGKVVRPFLGAGFGLYFLPFSNLPGTFYYGDDSAIARLGGIIRGGIKIRRAVIGLDYNIVPETYTQLSGGASYSKPLAYLSSSYLGWKVGIDIGGRWQ